MGYGTVDIRKVGEHSDKVAYAFHHEGKAGTFFIDKATGEFSNFSYTKDDIEARPAAAAQNKVKKAWESGELPDRLSWQG
ncbi:MAG: hypothetical protein ACRCY3_06015 [Sphingorhabdus sp.]